MNVFRDAIRAYRTGDVENALTLFNRAGEMYGFDMVGANIEECKRRLKGEDKLSCVLAAVINSVFDHVYLVNLQKHRRRRLSAAKQLRERGIGFELFEAVDGYSGEVLERYLRYAAQPLGSLSRFPEFREREVKRGSKFIESPGAFGYIETYLRILENARRKRYRRILILEDDVILHPDFGNKFYNFISGIRPDWKIVQLGASQYNWSSVCQPEALHEGYYLPRRLDTCGSFAIGVDSSIFEELIEVQSSFEAPFDHLPLGEIYERHLGSCFVAYPNIVMPDVGTSSIRGARDQDAHGRRMKWRVEEFPYPLPKASLSVQLTSKLNLRYFETFAESVSKFCDLRFYVSGPDGLRPVHDESFFDLPVNSEIDVDPVSALPPFDKSAWIPPAKSLTEEDLAHFLENSLLDARLSTSLVSMACDKAPVVSGRVSVIVPTYSRPTNLRAALESIAEQDYEDIQIIVVSDNDPNDLVADETAAVVDNFISQNPSISLKFIQHTTNRNGAAARNTGLMQSDGEFVCFLDDDDIYLPRRISSAVENLGRRGPEVGAVYCGFLGWNSPKEDPTRYKAGNLTRELLLLDYKSHYLHTNTATYRRSALLKIGGFDETYPRHQDLELNLRFFDHFEVGTVELCGVRLNPHPSTVSNKIFDTRFLHLKQKFLQRFRRQIQGLGSEADLVFSRHWNEVARYIKDEQRVVDELAAMLDNGPLQLLMRVGREAA